jgi:hypothetical protein
MQNAVPEANARPLTFGEKSVGITFNPGKNERVESIKQKFAAIIDELQEIKNPSSGAMQNGEVARMLSVAITEAQTAQMWAVKAVTWQY